VCAFICGWLALPAALVPLTLLFLVATVAQARYAPQGPNIGMRREPWKSSALALLQFGLPKQMQTSSSGFEGKEQMLKRGDKVLVRLRWTGDSVLGDGEQRLGRGVGTRKMDARGGDEAR
jgi:hypothetical protein